MANSEMKTIPGFPNYAITQDGRVWSKPRQDQRGYKRRGRWLKFRTDRRGYLYVLLHRGLEEIYKRIHHLVLETYIGIRSTNEECRHLNDIKKDNRLENLCWGTHLENMQDSIQNKTHSCLRRGSLNNRAKLTDDKVRVIRYLRDIANFTLADLAWQFDVARGTIWGICKRKRWTHI